MVKLSNSLNWWIPANGFFTTRQPQTSLWLIFHIDLWSIRKQLLTDDYIKVILPVVFTAVCLFSLCVWRVSVSDRDLIAYLGNKCHRDVIHRGWSNSLPLTRLTARWFTVFVGFFPPFFSSSSSSSSLLTSGVRTQARSLPGTQPPSVREAGEVERGGGGGEWGETVIFSSGPEGSPSLYKALCAAQELHSSYLLQEHGQQAAAAAAGWSSHKGIIQLSLSLQRAEEATQAAGYLLRKDKRWVSQMRHYTHLFL